MSTIEAPVIEAQPIKHRKRWSAEQKRRIVEETTQEGVSIAQVAKRHGISASLLYRWRGVLGVGARGRQDQTEVERLHDRVETLEGEMRRQAEQMQALLSSIATAQLVCR